MSLTANTSTAKVTNANATTSITFTPAANSLVVAFIWSDANNASTDEITTVTSTGHTMTLESRSNGAPGGSLEIWTTPVTTSASMTVDITSNKGSVSKYVRVVWFTDSGGSIPQFGRSDMRAPLLNADNLNPFSMDLVSSGVGSQFWLFSCAGSAFNAVTGQTIVVTESNSLGDNMMLSSVNSASSSADQTTALTLNPGGTWFHWIGIEITVPGVSLAPLDIRNIASGVTGNAFTPSATISVTTAANVQVGDVLLIIYANDYYLASNINTPTVSPAITVNSVTNGTADAGTNLGHAKAYTATVTTAGTHTVTGTENGATPDEEKALIVYVLKGANATIDVAGNGSGASSTTNTAPSVSPTGSNDLLICHTSSGAGDHAASYSPPSGMIETYELLNTVGMSAGGAFKRLTSSGATGTQSFTASSAVRYASLSIAVQQASAGLTISWLHY